MRSFEIYNKWSVQASKQANIHPHVCNAVTLVWVCSGSPQLSAYDAEIYDLEQPLLVNQPKKKEIRTREEDAGSILLIPELCTHTHLSDKAQTDIQTMKDIAITPVLLCRVGLIHWCDSWTVSRRLMKLRRFWMGGSWRLMTCCSTTMAGRFLLKSSINRAPVSISHRDLHTDTVHDYLSSSLSSSRNFYNEAEKTTVETLCW